MTSCKKLILLSFRDMRKLSVRVLIVQIKKLWPTAILQTIDIIGFAASGQSSEFQSLIFEYNKNVEEQPSHRIGR